MNATNRWLDRLATADRAQGGAGSDYRLAQLVTGGDRAQISKYRRGLQMTDAHALNAADALAQLGDPVHPAVIVGEIRSERGRTAREKRFWDELREKSAAVIVSASLGASIAAPGAISRGDSPSTAGAGGQAVPAYYVK